MKDGDRHRPVTVSFSSGNPALGSRTAYVIPKTRQLIGVNYSCPARVSVADQLD